MLQCLPFKKKKKRGERDISLVLTSFLFHPPPPRPPLNYYKLIMLVLELGQLCQMVGA